jgi:hypothetical protein
MPRRTAMRDAENRALASAEAVRKLDIAIAERAEALARSKAARRAVMQADAALRAASRYLGACDKQVCTEARIARAQAVKLKASTPRGPSRARRPYLSI